MTNILVTGANGCVGSALVGCLRRSSYGIIALALDDRDKDHIEDANNVDIVFGNICDAERMEEILLTYRPDAVIHLAATVHQTHADESEYEKVNYLGTKNLFELSKKCGVKHFIFVSTVAVYGNDTAGVLDEESPCNPQTPYATSKLKAEERIREQGNLIINYTIIRPSTVYGDRDKGNIGKLFNMAKIGVVPLVGSGHNLKSLIYVENLVEGIARVLLNPAAYNQTFILSDNESYSVNRLLSEMKRIIGKRLAVIHLPSGVALFLLNGVNRMYKILYKKEFINTSSIAKTFTNNVFDTSKARRVLNFDPPYSLAEGLEKAYGHSKKSN